MEHGPERSIAEFQAERAITRYGSSKDNRRVEKILSTLSNKTLDLDVLNDAVDIGYNTQKAHLKILKKGRNVSKSCETCASMIKTLELFLDKESRSAKEQVKSVMLMK